MHRVAAGNFIVNITFGWEHAVAITDKNDAGKLVSHRFPQFSFAEGMVPEFFRYVIVDEKFRHHLWLASPGGAGRNRVLKLDEMLNYLMRFPSRDEQIKIAEFFRHLDNLITLHQRQSFSHSTPDISLSVQLIHPFYTSSWEQRKLGDNIIEYTEVTTKNNQYPPLTSSRKGIFLQTEYFAGNQIASDNNTGYNIVPYGYFTYRHMSDDEIFHFNINDIVENGIVSTLYPVFTTDESLDSRYLQYQLNYGSEFAKFAILQKQGGSRTYIYLNKLKQLNLTMPKSVEEQKTISAFFMNLDHLITLHQRKGKAAVSGCSNDANNSKGVCCKARDFGYKCHKKDESK